MLERVLPREYALADQAFSQQCALTARHEDFGVLLILECSGPNLLRSHCPAPARSASSMVVAEAAGIEFPEPSFIIRQTLAREMQCFFAT